MKIKKYLLSLLLTISIITLPGCITSTAVGVSIASATGAAVYANNDRRTAGSFLDDKTIELKVKKQLYLDKKLWKNSNITIASFNGVVLVTGQTINEDFRNKIHFIIHNTPKVRTIYNELTIGKLATIANKAKDAWVTTKVKTLVLKEKVLSANKIKVITEDGIVYLLGIVTKDEEKLAIKVANSVSGTKSVIKIFEYVEK